MNKITETKNKNDKIFYSILIVITVILILSIFYLASIKGAKLRGIEFCKEKGRDFFSYKGGSFNIKEVSCITKCFEENKSQCEKKIYAWII